MIKVYHGSNIEIDNIDLSKSKKYKDFGTGFYVTTILEQARDRAVDIATRKGGEPVVTIFDFNDEKLSEISCKEFDNVSEDWAYMVINNRDKDYKDFNNSLSNHYNKYDVVYGPVANDDVLGSIALFINGRYNIGEVVKRFECKKYNNQYSFHTEKAVELLTKVSAEKFGKTNSQELVITYLITKIVNYIAEDKNITVEEAMNIFYSTEISKEIEDVKNGYYKEGAGYLYEMVKEELNKKE